MKKSLTSFLRPLLPLVISLLTFSLIRWLFYRMHYWGETVTAGDLALLLYWGFRVDLAIILLLSIPYLLYWLTAGLFFPRFWSPLMAALLFLCGQLPALLVNWFDLGYFRHSRRRSGTEILELVQPALEFIPGIFRMYWWLILGGVLLLLLFSRSICRLLKTDGVSRWGALAWVLVGAVVMVWNRGALIPTKPLVNVRPVLLPIVQNSMSTLLYSWQRGNQYLARPEWVKDEVPELYAELKKEYGNGRPMHKQNVVIIILESFIAEVLREGSVHKAETPFLDSLLNHSIVFSRAVSNSFQSNQGMVSIMGGFPSPPYAPFFNTPYSSNRFRGIGQLLKEEGYSSFFALGAGADHFGFNRFMNYIGIDNIITKEDYGRPEHEDGNWGVFDHYFLPWVTARIETYGQPFLGVMYNMSSHPPYIVPESWSGPGSDHPEEYQRSISYVDYALKQSFEVARQSSWFDSTYFVFVADHGITYDKRYARNWTTLVSIPFFIYHPSFSESKDVQVLVQQWDMIPTMLDLLGYSKPFFSFGESAFRKGEAAAFNMLDHSVRVYSTEYMAEMNLADRKIEALYRYRQDSMLTQNLAGDPRYDSLLHYFQQTAADKYQQWYQALEKNKMLIP